MEMSLQEFKVSLPATHQYKLSSAAKLLEVTMNNMRARLMPSTGDSNSVIRFFAIIMPTNHTYVHSDWIAAARRRERASEYLVSAVCKALL